MNLQIELQDVIDAKNMDQESPLAVHAENVIRDGGTVEVTLNGNPKGRASTLEELDELLNNA